MSTTNRGGRPRDASRDVAILDAALAVLAESGYEAMTMDQVARHAGAGKATVYRRWSSKAELVADAVGRIGGEVSVADLPDTGTLRGDLQALFRPQSADDTAYTLAITRGLASLLSTSPELAEVASRAMVDPFVSSQRLLMQRAVDRGELPPGADVETVARVTPSMTAFRLVVERRGIDVDELMHLVDTVVLPALHAPG